MDSRLWTVVQRLAAKGRLLVSDPAEAGVRLQDRWLLLRLRAQNRFGSRAITGQADCAVSITTYGARALLAFAAIESIARSPVLPREFYLWLDDDALLANLPRQLRRLQRRGLTIARCPDYGPHKKQYPYAVAHRPHEMPLVTADDDVVYPLDWLAGLLTVHRTDPDVIIGYRARTMSFDAGALRPYAEWKLNTDDRPGLCTLITGVSGVIYPPRLLELLADAGTGFLDVAPRADDIWVHSIAARNGIRSRQAWAKPRTFRAVKGAVEYGSHTDSLTHQNVFNGENDRQIAASYDADTMARIRRDAGDGHLAHD